MDLAQEQAPPYEANALSPTVEPTDTTVAQPLSVISDGKAQ